SWFLFLLRTSPLSSPLFPYTTLFRSDNILLVATSGCASFFTELLFQIGLIGITIVVILIIIIILLKIFLKKYVLNDINSISQNRSEEHTSELQSRFDLVCRLLLEKKK